MWIEEMQKINLSFILDLECTKDCAKRFCYHIVHCCRNIIADFYDQIFGDGISLFCKLNDRVKLGNNGEEFLFG